MAVKTWTLVDVDEQIFVESMTVTPADVEGDATGYRVEKRRLYGGTQDGVDIIEIDNGVFSFVVLLTRGMGLWFAERDGVRFGWNSPTRSPVHPSLVPIEEPSGIGWLDGFNEMLVRCGLESNGAPEFDERGVLKHPLHGRIANLPARQVELTIDGQTGAIALRGIVHESRLFFRGLELETVYSVQVGQTGLEVNDTVTNLSAEPASFQMLYHANFGPPLLAEGAKFLVPVRQLAPRDAGAATNIDAWDVMGPETPGSHEVCFYTEPVADEDGQTMALLRNPGYDLGVGIGFNINEMPCFTLWKSRLSAVDGYVAGLEPGTNYPNVHSFERTHGRVVPLAPGESRSLDLTLTFLTAADAVHATERAIADIQSQATPAIEHAPNPSWSPMGDG